jgi:ubiquinone/menaquinone biosynthesis C-methylase UbiE
MNILDAGCGTGSHLDLYRRYGCSLYGLDLSPSMLAVARERLGVSARLEIGSAASMPYGNNQFDLIITMLSLHEMAPEIRSAAIKEMTRVLKESGRMLLIDFRPGPVEPLQGWISKTIIFFSELAAGREHFNNYRHFISNGGLSMLAAQHHLKVEKEKMLAGGTFALYLAFPENVREC